MRAVKPIREVPARHNGSFESLLGQFSAATRELTRSLGPTEFSRRLTARAAEIFGARACALALQRASKWEIASLSGPAHNWGAEVQQGLALALVEQANVSSQIRLGPAGRLLGRELADALDWHDLILVRLTATEGTILGVLGLEGVGSDLSQQKYQLLEALASHVSVTLENMRLLSRIETSRKQWVEDFDAITDLIVVHDHAGTILRSNRAFANLIGIAPAATVGKDIGRLGLMSSPVVTGKCPFCCELDGKQEAFVSTAGSREYSISTSRIHAEEEIGMRSIHVIKDVTDAASMRANLMHTEKMAALGQLVSGVAHEVNNPLTAIVGFADLLLEDPAIPEAAKEELGIILQEAERTRTIVQNLLSFARQMPAQQEPMQINTALRKTLQLRAYDFSNHGCEVIECYDRQLPLIEGDSHKLLQVFLNIVNNAYDAICDVPRPGRLEITTSHRDRHIEIAFRDNGPGISNPERIFEPFFTTKGVGKGTGLGLSICYGIIQAHGGEIVARNNSEGPGCTFLVRLPVAEQPVMFLDAELAR